MTTRTPLTRARLATVGAELADEVGFEHVTASEVARRCGVRVASLYSHVRDADDLRALVCLLALDELADRASAAVAGRAGAEALAALAGAYRDYARAHPGRYAAMRHRLDPATAAASAGPRHADLTRAALRGYGLDADGETHAVRLFGGLVHGFVTLELAGAFDHSDPSPEVSWEWSLTALDATLTGWSTR
ncbi:TetR/AcrR family transcriptional regulator [Nocardioides rubriscoriae]|uniref:TetR/AcrR family transcriptional regulator n=1 Tax=Nocardioides rubriscoriae TaxID=642762 RepID=UPI0011DFD813|nr:TetR/AcrR family transcriptional regulator [Nocardioides rubriscoriae]